MQITEKHFMEQVAAVREELERTFVRQTSEILNAMEINGAQLAQSVVREREDRKTEVAALKETVDNVSKDLESVACSPLGSSAASVDSTSASGGHCASATLEAVAESTGGLPEEVEFLRTMVDEVCRDVARLKLAMPVGAEGLLQDDATVCLDEAAAAAAKAAGAVQAVAERVGALEERAARQESRYDALGAHVQDIESELCNALQDSDLQAVVDRLQHVEEHCSSQKALVNPVQGTARHVAHSSHCLQALVSPRNPTNMAVPAAVCTAGAGIVEQNLGSDTSAACLPDAVGPHDGREPICPAQTRVLSDSVTPTTAGGVNPSHSASRTLTAVNANEATTEVLKDVPDTPKRAPLATLELPSEAPATAALTPVSRSEPSSSMEIIDELSTGSSGNSSPVETVAWVCDESTPVPS